MSGMTLKARAGVVAAAVAAVSLIALAVTVLLAAGPSTAQPAPAGLTPSGPGTPVHGAHLVTAHVAAPAGARGVVAVTTMASATVPPGWVVSAHTLVVGHLARAYLTVEPATMAAARPASVPVVVLMHGLNMSPGGVLAISGLARQVGPAVLIVPAGWHRSWDAGGCCGAAYRFGVDDVGFVRRAVADVLARTPAADSHRIYLAGFSNGGRMAYRLACDLPGTFAGFAAVEAVPVATCPALHPLDITVVAQEADPLLTVGAGAVPKHVDGHVEPTVAATLQQWRALDRCSASPAVAEEGGAVVHIWACAAGTHLTYVWYPGGAHNWRPPTATTPGATSFVAAMITGAGGARAH